MRTARGSRRRTPHERREQAGLDFEWIYRELAKRFQWATPWAVGDLTMAQALFYLDQSPGGGEVALHSPSEVLEYAREFRRRKGLPEPPAG